MNKISKGLEMVKKGLWGLKNRWIRNFKRKRNKNLF